MRRMLDPKTIEGGGGGNLYCHQIELTDTLKNMITLNYFSNSYIPFTRSSFIEKIGSHHLSCSGAISSTISGTKIKYIAAYLYINNNKTISCYAINIDTSDYEYYNLDSFNFTDNVVPA